MLEYFGNFMLHFMVTLFGIWQIL